MTLGTGAGRPIQAPGIFDATVPVTQDHGDSAATGSSSKAARRDHVHGMPATLQLVPAAIQVAAGDYQFFVSLFNDTTGLPDRCIVVTVLSTNTIALVEYKRLGNAWVFDPADCAFDASVTLNYTADFQGRMSGFAINSPVASGDRVLFIAGNNDDTTDTFEMDSIVLTPGGSSLTATAVVIAGTNQPTDTNSMGTCGIPLSTTRVMTFFQDDAHFADVTFSTPTYTFTYDDAKVLAVDTSINVGGVNAYEYSGIVVGSQLVLLRAGGPSAVTNDDAYEMSTTATLTESFEPFRAGLMGSDQASAGDSPAAVTAIGGAFAIASPAGGDGADGQMAGYLVSTFPLDDI